MAATRNFGRGTATVNIQNIGPKLLDGAGGGSDQLWLIPTQLHGNRTLFWQEVELFVAAARLGADTGGIGHLAANQATAAKAQDQASEDTVGDADHGCQNNIGPNADRPNHIAFWKMGV